MKLKTWIEINQKAAIHNIGVFRGLIGPKVKLASVVKSNAYGHGLYDYAVIVSSGVDYFCVDSVFEAETLRKHNIKKPILVLGMTLSSNYDVVIKNNCAITISNINALKDWIKSKNKPKIHIKIDTGMNRQGFFINEIPQVIKLVTRNMLHVTCVEGIYTHFSSAKDINYPTYTEMQFQKFQKAIALFAKKGFTKLIKHAAASSATILNPKYHFDMVRIGMGLYGHAPSKEIKIQFPQIKLKPVLRWKTIISEIKEAPKGSYVSYDLTERLNRKTKIGILPIGYWHGLPWALSGVGDVIINNERAKILGRVTMDVVMVDVTDIACKIMDKVEIDIIDASFKARTSYYEFLTRINPLIERIIV
ncbi:MAG: alanine racemase [bacterium]|nr:alanine racemase [bacterium]